MISVVCPFYNEESILESSLTLMLEGLSTLEEPWELVVVNDGSRDGSLAIARAVEQRDTRLRVISYRNNQGRGFAIRTGIRHARGRIVVTTEIDCSWGNDIVHRILEEFQANPDADMVIASPHLPGGGYKNVPAMRVFFSTVGNYIIRSGLTYQVSMNTGMTRGYKREKFLALPLEESGKEMHLEIVNKALALRYRICEIPALLEWKDHKSASGTPKRRSSTRISGIVRTHLLFSVLAAPFRYLYAMSGVLVVAAFAFALWAGYRMLFTGETAVFIAFTGFFLGLFGVQLFGVSILAQQNRALHRDLWKTQAMLKTFQASVSSDSPDGEAFETDRSLSP